MVKIFAFLTHFPWNNMPICSSSVPSICISITLWLALITVFQDTMLLKLEQDLIKYINKHRGTRLHKSGTGFTDFQGIHKDLHYYQQRNIWLCFFAISTYLNDKSQIGTLTAPPRFNFFIWSRSSVSGSSLGIQRGFWCQRFKRLCLLPAPFRGLKGHCFPQHHPIGMALPAASTQHLSCPFKTQQLSLPCF